MKNPIYLIGVVILLTALAFPQLQAQSPLPTNGFSITVDQKTNAVGEVPLSTENPDQPSAARGTVDPVLAQFLQVKLDEVRQIYDYKGISAAVRLPGGDIWAGTSGISGAAQPLTQGDLFAIGSTTKTFTAACILQMMEAGSLSLEDSVGRWLSPTPNINVNKITVRQCLQHTSGIFNFTNHPNFGDSINADGSRVWTMPEVLSRFVAAPDFAPGTSWNYSNTNFVLLGQIIESISGKTFHQEIRDRFLTPLSLNTVFFDPHEPVPPFMQKAHPWQQGTGGVLFDLTANGYDLTALFSAAWAAGSYYSSASDIAEWMWQLYGGHLHSAATMQEVLDFYVVNTSFAYGLGTIRQSYSGQYGNGHGGDIIFGEQAFYFPQENISIVAQTNDGRSTSAGMNPVIDTLLNTYLNWRDAQPSTGVEDQLLAALTTVYPNPFQDQVSLSIELTQPQPVSITLTNGLGQVVAKESYGVLNGENTLRLPIHENASGLYLYRIQAGEAVQMGRLVKE